MKTTLLAQTGLVSISILLTFSLASAKMPSIPTDSDFSKLPNGKYLSDIEVSGEPLYLSRGSGEAFGASEQAAYQKLKAASMADNKHKVQWVLRDLDNDRVIAQSAGAERKIFGASSSKIFVGGTILDKQAGAISSSQLQLMSDMLVVSSNEAWSELQRQIGDGDSNKGRELNFAFTQRMGYEQTRGFQGYWGKIHGNELSAMETTEYLADIFKGNFPGAETLWKIMHTCRTGANRGRRYLPTSLYVGGKTGTYDGDTENPENGSEIYVAIRNHVLVFNVQGREYGLAILADSGTDDSAALLAGGLLREYTGYQDL